MKAIRKLLIIFAVLASVPLHAQRWSISTNAVEWADLGTLNAEASYAFGRHFSVHAGARYNPWTYNPGNENEQVQRRQRSFAAGLRYWPWHVYAGWWVSTKGQYQEYNRGGLQDRQTEEGDAYGGALSAGYSWMLSPHVNLEFGAGVWAGSTKYKVYACPVCGRIVDQGNKFFILPTDLSISLVLVL